MIEGQARWRNIDSKPRFSRIRLLLVRSAAKSFATHSPNNRTLLKTTVDYRVAAAVDYRGDNPTRCASSSAVCKAARMLMLIRCSVGIRIVFMLMTASHRRADSIHVTVGTLYRIGFVCAQVRIETE